VDRSRAAASPASAAFVAGTPSLSGAGDLHNSPMWRNPGMLWPGSGQRGGDRGSAQSSVGTARSGAAPSCAPRDGHLHDGLRGDRAPRPARDRRPVVRSALARCHELAGAAVVTVIAVVLSRETARSDLTGDPVADRVSAGAGLR